MSFSSQCGGGHLNNVNRFRGESELANVESGKFYSRLTAGLRKPWAQAAQNNTWINVYNKLPDHQIPQLTR